MNIRSLFTHPHAVPNPGLKQLVDIDFYSMEIWKSMATVWLSTFFKISYFVKERNSGLEQLEDE